MDSNELERLVTDLESPRVERKSSASDGERLRQAICAFANDLPDSKLPGYLFIGLDDSGKPVGLEINDRLVLSLTAMRSDGNILPLPQMVVEKVVIQGQPLAVIEVRPSPALPVRYKGQVWIRVGARRDIATREEERRLVERDVHASLTFDRRPCQAARIEDLDTRAFLTDYLPKVIAASVIQDNNRTIEYQLASLRFFDLRHRVPTNCGVLVFGSEPRSYLPGAYIQVTRYEGHTRADRVVAHWALRGSLPAQLRQMDELLPLQVHSARLAGPGLKHHERPDYPLSAIRELALNAVMHRTYEGTSAPVRIYWYSDRVEISSPGGLYGHVTPDNYERVSDYRNPVIAEVMKNLNYVEQFGTGITRAQAALAANGCPPARFEFNPTDVLVTLRPAVRPMDVAAKHLPSIADTSPIPEPDLADELAGDIFIDDKGNDKGDDESAAGG